MLPAGTSDFPFDLVVISFPDASAAEAASPELRTHLGSWLPCPWVATSDPAGQRVGSGGATLDAIRSSYRRTNEENEKGDIASSSCSASANASILLILAGGESSRAPTQMVLGKAWTSLPSAHPDFTAAASSSTRIPTATMGSASNTRVKPSSKPAPPLDASGATTLPALTTPLVVGLKLLVRVLRGLPKGSVLVMAGDTMLNLPTDVPSWEQLCEQYRRCRLQRLHDDDDEKEEQSCGGNTHSYADVIGVAVPAPIETAQNHGVYLLDERSIEGRDQATPDFGEAGLFPCSQVWQKPPIERLRDYHARRSYSGARYQGAWIDTGIVIFLPHVVQALLELSDPYFAPIKINPDQGPLVKTEPLPKLDLYTHILQAFRTTSASLGNTASDGRSAKERYCESLYSGDSKGRDLAPLVWDTLSGFALSVWCLPGDFLHLGTSRELARFLSVASTATSPVHRSRDAPDNRCDPEGINDSDHQTLLLDSDELLRRMGRSLRLVRRCNAHYATGVAWDDPESVVACHILLKNEAFPSAPLAVGSRTVLEHCWIEVPSDYRHSRVRIGSNCLVSGLRYIGAKYSLNVPDGMIVQMVSLPPPEPMHNEEASIGTVPLQVSREIALVVLGIDDPIKSRDTLFGRPFQAFLEWCQLSEHDIWDEGSHPASRTVWTARIHAVIDNRATTSTIFDWLTDFVAYNSEGRNECFAFKARHLESLAAWKASKRLSLAEIRDATGAAAAEFEYRRLLATRLDFERDEYFHRVARLMSTRVLEPLDWRWIVDDYTATNCVQPVLDMLRALDWVIQESLLGDTTGPKLDVCGRACRVAGAFLRDICDTSVRHSNDSCEQSHSTDFGFSSVTMNSLGPILPFFKTCASKRDKCVLESPLETFRESLRMMDAMAQLMTEQCVLGESPTTTVLCGSNSRQSTARPVINRWVVATAPARIDLAGGWTDTPPICFEYGSFVTGVAVLVDGLKPLSCSCRILSGSSGIRLRTESRDGRTGDLLSSPVDVRIMDCVDLEDFRKPTSDCALLKCALVLLGLLEPLNRKKGSLDDKPELQELVNEFCQVDYTVGIEIVASSSLPQGSGLGTSSILGGCVIASIHRCLGHDVAASDEWIDELVDSVLRLEQLLTTGGGFQDQVNGLTGGAKATSCDPSVFPFKLQIERLHLGCDALNSLDERLMLAFTGKTRLAKNLLQNVLRRWSAQTTEIHEVVEGLVSGAKRSRDALLANDLDAVGECLLSYWEQKKVMAGLQSGVEPTSVKRIIDVLLSHRAISGASLCGAGGGGFLVLIRSRKATEEDVRRIVADCVPDSGITWHQCAVSESGLHVEVLDDVTQEQLSASRTYNC